MSKIKVLKYFLFALKSNYISEEFRIVMKKISV